MHKKGGGGLEILETAGWHLSIHKKGVYLLLAHKPAVGGWRLVGGGGDSGRSGRGLY